jgi:hypothetical protein
MTKAERELERELAWAVKTRKATQILIDLCKAGRGWRRDPHYKIWSERAKQLDAQIKDVKRRMESSQ